MRLAVIFLFFFDHQSVICAEYFTRSQVQDHASQGSCWIIIDNKVYDITHYLPKHPKSESFKLVQACGQDSTEGWKTKGIKQKPHSQKAQRLLKNYLIGSVVHG